MIVPVLIVVGLLVALEYAQPREAGQSPGGVWPLFVGMGVGYAFLIRAFRLWAIPMALIYFPLMWWILLSAGHITGLFLGYA